MPEHEAVVPFYKRQVLQELGARAIRRPLREYTIRQTVTAVEATSRDMTVRLRTQMELHTGWQLGDVKRHVVVPRRAREVASFGLTRNRNTRTGP